MLSLRRICSKWIRFVMAADSVNLAARGKGEIAPSARQVRAHLAQLLASEMFVRSDRLCRFLQLTVERMLAGETVNEYILGKDVFDRDDRYDPRIDSIVRVEARRLRKKLHEYYNGPGASDP